MVEVGIGAGGHGVKRITNACGRRSSPRDQRLRPEPDAQRQGREHDPAGQAAPLMASFGVGHLQGRSRSARTACTGALTPVSRLPARVRAPFASRASPCLDKATFLRVETDPGGAARAPANHILQAVPEFLSTYHPEGCATPSDVRLFVHRERRSPQTLVRSTL